MLHQCRLFFIALQFFTRLPIPRWVGFDAVWLQHAARYFPLVGVIVGAVTAAVYAAAALVWPSPVAVLLSTAAGIWLTGAFHEDGFADTCDGFGGGMTADRVMEIMKDSRIGTYGAVGIGMLLAVKCATLAYLPPTTAMAALLLAHPLSRLAATVLIWKLDYARAEGKAKPLAQQMDGGELTIAIVCAALPVLAIGCAGALPWATMAGAVLASAACATWLASIFVRRIGGFTGDCLGAVQQLCEVAIYLCVLAGARHAGWP